MEMVLADGCDVCPLDVNDDSDGDTVCDSEDRCPGQNDLMGGRVMAILFQTFAMCVASVTTLSIAIPTVIPMPVINAPMIPWNDSDLDDVCDSEDVCLAGDDNINTDGDGIPDACDACPLDFNDDSDGDGRCDSNDICTGDDLSGDSDGDGTCNNLDEDDDNDNCLDVTDSAPTVFSADADGDGLGAIAMLAWAKCDG